MSNKTDWKIPKLDIKESEWYVCTNSWSDDGWCKFEAGDVVQAVRDNVFKDCYDVEHDFSIDGICYFRPADKDEIPEKYRLKDIELTEFEQALYDRNIEGESFICAHDEIECKHEVRRIANELLPLARKQLMAEIWHKESEHPGNRHPYPVLNPDGEMAYAYYEELCGWQFDRDFKRSTRMLWLDIEKILPKED